MSNYTTKTAALKATKIDSRLLNANRIDTKKLFINGTQFDPSQIKESPNEAMFTMFLMLLNEQDVITEDYGYIIGYYTVRSAKTYTFEDEEWGSSVTPVYEYTGLIFKLSETDNNLGLEKGIYMDIRIDQSFMKCICDKDDTGFSFISPNEAKFQVASIVDGEISLESCILDTKYIQNEGTILIKLCEEDDNLSELYGGAYPIDDQTEDLCLLFIFSVPYYIQELDTQNTTYSLRQPQQISLLDRLKQQYVEMKQKNLTNLS